MTKNNLDYSKLMSNINLFDFLMNQTEQVVCILDCHLKLQRANPRFYEVSQYQPEQLLYKFFNVIIDEISDKISFELLNIKLAELLECHTSFSQVLKVNTADNRVISLPFSFSPILRPDCDTIHILCMANISQKTLDFEKVIYDLTYTDQITELGNRSFFLKKIDYFFGQVETNNFLGFFLSTFEFDNMKKIDDLYGHKVGDMLIKESAVRLREITHDSDILFRVSGSKLGVLHATEKLENVEVWSQAILDAISESYQIEGHLIDTQLSMGALRVPQDAANVVEVIKHIELAYYKATEVHNCSSMVLYSRELSEQTIHTLSIEKALKKALIDDNIEVFYQPKFSLPERNLEGFEALVRWRHPERGLVSPLEFIPIAEETGLIIEIGNRVLEKACEQSVLWSQKISHRAISINISVMQLTDRNFLHSVADIIKRTGVDPTSIEFEITESIIMGNLKESILILNELREWGISIALDDFGTGYSSLSYIKEIPLDVLKIDRAFIKNIPHNQKDCAIVKTILTLAKELSIKVVAEGMEEEEQVMFLEQQLCDSAQGFYFSHPLEASDADKLVSSIIQ